MGGAGEEPAKRHGSGTQLRAKGKGRAFVQKLSSTSHPFYCVFMSLQLRGTLTVWTEQSFRNDFKKGKFQKEIFSHS